MKQDISVSIGVSLRGVNHISGSATALFVGGFSILEMDKVMRFFMHFYCGFFYLHNISGNICINLNSLAFLYKSII